MFKVNPIFIDGMEIVSMDMLPVEQKYRFSHWVSPEAYFSLDRSEMFVSFREYEYWYDHIFTRTSSLEDQL